MLLDVVGLVGVSSVSIRENCCYRQVRLEVLEQTNNCHIRQQIVG